MLRRVVIPIVLLAAMLAPPSARASDNGVEDPKVAIAGVRMADDHVMKIDIATSGLGAGALEWPTVALTVWLDGVPAHAALPLIHMPSRFTMDMDLPAGLVRVAGVVVGDFKPIPRFEENLRFPIEVTVSHGPRASTARTMATILLPTVVVPGYLNEMGGLPGDVLTVFRRHGYLEAGTAQTLFWLTYHSQVVTLEQGAQALDAYVRQVVLPASYAKKINVIGYSFGGLMARWNLAYVDGWGTLVNRLVLIGVPNEGSTMAYVWRHAPSFLPFSGLGRTPAIRTLTPTFPFWRSRAGDQWTAAPDGRDGVLDRLNAQPIPRGVRVYVFYGSHDPRDSAGPRTAVGVTGELPAATLSFAPGDGVVLADSAQGLPINGGAGVPALAERTVLRVNLGSVYHTGLLQAGADRMADALTDRYFNSVDETSPDE